MVSQYVQPKFLTVVNRVDCTKEHIDQQRILSYCYGYGGLDRGISAIMPTRTVAYVEIEAFQNFNLVAAMEAGLVDQAPIWTNLKTFDAEPFRNRVHGIIGGYPCQGESLAGKRKLWEDDRFLWPYIERSVATIRPVWCFFENVGGHLTGSFPYVEESLRNMGYAVEAGLFTAAEVGAPHKRERLFIFAIDQNANRTEIGQLLANTPSERNGESSQEYETGQFNQKGYQWPARPGQQQHDWEEPRTIPKKVRRKGKSGSKSGMGSTVNGYNFRTELLRQYGNGVVSQTASLAFETLTNKLLTENK